MGGKECLLWICTGLSDIGEKKQGLCIQQGLCFLFSMFYHPPSYLQLHPNTYCGLSFWSLLFSWSITFFSSWQLCVSCHVRFVLTGEYLCLFYRFLVLVLLGKCLLLLFLYFPFLVSTWIRRPPFSCYIKLDLSGEYPILLRLYIDVLAFVCEDFPCISLLVVTTSGGTSISFTFKLLTYLSFSAW